MITSVRLIASRALALLSMRDVGVSSYMVTSGKYLDTCRLQLTHIHARELAMNLTYSLPYRLV